MKTIAKRKKVIIMDKEREMKIIVKANTYKDVKNFMHNELKMTKPEMEKIIEKYVHRFLVTGDKFNELIDEKIYEAVTKTTSKYYSQHIHTNKTFEQKVALGVNKLVNDALTVRIEALIKEQAETLLKEKLGL